jgi:hypothetical protein
MTSSALQTIPQPGSGALVQREADYAKAIEGEDDEQVLHMAEELFGMYGRHSEAASEEAKAAQRLRVKVRIRIGQLLGPPMTKAESAALTDGKRSTPAEQVAVHRARQLADAAKHVDVDAVLAKEPTAAAVVRAAQEAIIDHQPDPAKEECQRVHRTIRGPQPDTWPNHYDMASFDDGAWATVSESLDSWRRWCDAWEAAAAAQPKLRRVK